MVWAWNLVCGFFINFRNGRKILTSLILVALAITKIMWKWYLIRKIIFKLKVKISVTKKTFFINNDAHCDDLFIFKTFELMLGQG